MLYQFVARSYRNKKKKYQLENSKMVVAMQKSIQCAVVGDGFVGKSSLVQKFVNGKFDKTYIATLKDDYSAKVSTNGDVFRLNVSDIAGEVSRSYFYIFRKRCSSAYHFLRDVLCIIPLFLLFIFCIAA